MDEISNLQYLNNIIQPSRRIVLFDFQDFIIWFSIGCNIDDIEFLPWVICNIF